MHKERSNNNNEIFASVRLWLWWRWQKMNMNTNVRLMFDATAKDHLKKFGFTMCKSPWMRVNHENATWNTANWLLWLLFHSILHFFPESIVSCCFFFRWIFQPISSIIIPFSCFIEHCYESNEATAAIFKQIQANETCKTLFGRVINDEVIA